MIARFGISVAGSHLPCGLGTGILRDWHDDKVLALSWISHFGDLHQQVHFSDLKNRGRQPLCVKYRGSNGLRRHADLPRDVQRIARKARWMRREAGKSLPDGLYLTSSRIALSSPSSVSGYIRLAMSWRTMRIEYV